MTAATLRVTSAEPELERFFDAAVDSFAAAAAARGATDLELRIADRPARIRFAGTGLPHLTRALGHLTHDLGDQAPALEILAWDGAPAPPAPPWRLGQQGALGEIVGLATDRFHINYHDQSGLLCMVDTRTGRALYWLPRADALPYWELGSPFRILFHRWASALGGVMVHAAAVGVDGRGVLLVGKSGSGKSTTAVTCLDAGMSYAGDDYVLLMGNPRPTAYSLYSSAKLHARFMDAALPHWRGRVAAEIGPEQKALFFLAESLPAPLVTSLTIGAVVAPRVSDGELATLTPLSPAAGLLALAPSTIFAFPGARHQAMTSLTGWIRGVPTFALETGRDLASGPAALQGLIERSAHV